METTRLSSKGQVILPKSIRDAHRWQPGTEFVVEETTEGILLRPAKTFPAASVMRGSRRRSLKWKRRFALR